MLKLLDYQNFLRYCSSCLNFLYNYFDDSTKLFVRYILARSFQEEKDIFTKYVNI